MTEDKHGFTEVDESQIWTNKEDKLDAIFRMQKYFVDQLFEAGKFPYPREVSVEKLSVAILTEAIELRNLTNWKWWKQHKQFNETEAKEELIDIFHFVIHTALVLGMTPDDFLNIYEYKMEINKQRQREGY